MNTILNGATHLRKLSLKSLIKFGLYKTLTVQEVINLGNFDFLISTYYSSSNISYTDDVLDILCITPDRQIQKPGKSKPNCKIWEIVKDARYKNLSVNEFKKLKNLSERESKRIKAVSSIKSNIINGSKSLNRSLNQSRVTK